MFRIKYINGDRIETTSGVAFILGQAFHHAIDAFFRTVKEDPVREGLEVGLAFIEEYPEGFIKWSTTIANKQDLKEKFVYAYNIRVKELRKDDKVMATEHVMEHDIDLEWGGKRISLPVTLKGVSDRIYRDEENRIVIEDDKVCYKFSDPEKIDGRKILQTIQLYFLVYAEFGEEPYKMRFVETKYTGSAKTEGEKTKAYEIVYADNELFFDFYLRFYNDTVRALMGEQVYLPNVDTLFDNEVGIIAYTQHLDVPEEKAKQQKKYKVDNITDILKKNVASIKKMNLLKQAVSRSLVEYKNIDYSKMQEHEKIATKFMEFGIVIKYDSVVDGGSFRQYRYMPSIGVKMRSLSSFSADVEQILGVSGIRIVAPIPDTSFIGIEIPKKDREFVTLNERVIGNKDDGLPIGIDLGGEILRLSLDDMPHMLVAGATGSGKSVFLSSMIESITKQYSGLDLYLIDTKMVELSNFANRAVSIAYDSASAREILSLLVDTMEKRYKTMLKGKSKHHSESGMKKIVCVIDEFADLILSKTKSDRGLESIENLMIRLAQKGRAAGIHLIIATQRPDKDVITGLIKANFPTKVAFATSSEMNSRIILDERGAEKLLGKGDGLISNPKLSGIKRFQGFTS